MVCLDSMLMLPVWESICDGKSHLGLLIDGVLNSVFGHLSRLETVVAVIDGC